VDNNQPANTQIPQQVDTGKTNSTFIALIAFLLVALGSFFLGQHINIANIPNNIPKAEENSTTSELITKTQTNPINPSPVATTMQLNENIAQTYTDTDTSFSLSYPKGWTLKKTYGKNIVKQAPTDVVSGIEIDSQGNSATFVVNVIDGKGAGTITQWWQTGGHLAFNTTQPNYSFKGIDAIKVSSTPGGNPPTRVEDETYFLSKGQIYFLSMQYTPYNMDSSLVNIYNSFSVSQ